MKNKIINSPKKHVIVYDILPDGNAHAICLNYKDAPLLKYNKRNLSKMLKQVTKFKQKKNYVILYNGELFTSKITKLEPPILPIISSVTDILYATSTQNFDGTQSLPEELDG